MKKNNSLKIFNLLARRVYKISKKRKLGWKWSDAQKWTSANLFKRYKGTAISKIKVTNVVFSEGQAVFTRGGAGGAAGTIVVGMIFFGY